MIAYIVRNQLIKFYDINNIKYILKENFIINYKDMRESIYKYIYFIFIFFYLINIIYIQSTLSSFDSEIIFIKYSQKLKKEILTI